MKKKVLLMSAIIAVFLGVTFNLQAQLSPVGIWKTIDDETNQAKSQMQIWESNGKYYGKILRLLKEPNGGKGKTCTNCNGRFKNKPLIGMTIMWGLKYDEDNEYSGGRIMDPNNGKVYRCLIEVQKGGKKLRVRGYIGFSLLGRNQYWYKIR